MRPGLVRDERGLLGGSFIRTFIFLLLAGLIVVEGAAIVFARVQVQDVAETAAAVGSGNFKTSNDIEQARAQTELAIQDKDPKARLTVFEVLEDGSVRVVVEKKASTLIVQRFGFSRHLSIAKGRALGQPPPV